MRQASHVLRFFLLILFLAGSFSGAKAGNTAVMATFNVTLTCTAEPLSGTFIRLTGTGSFSTEYTILTDSTGHAVIGGIVPGQYTLTVQRFHYDAYSSPVNLTANQAFTVNLTEMLLPARYLAVNPQSLAATWNSPSTSDTLLAEDWGSGSFATNQWTTSGGTNWLVSSIAGNPVPSAIFFWSPPVVNYHQYLTSREIVSSYAVKLQLRYDFYLSGYCFSPFQYLAVEIFNGTSWDTLKTYSLLFGAYPWTHEEVDITGYSVKNFRIRFHAYGDDSYSINEWSVDNISIIAYQPVLPLNPCVTGYPVLLNSQQIGIFPGTSMTIPPAMVQYGQSYQLCVKATYANGTSGQLCAGFISEYLPAPTNLQADSVECNAVVTWSKPQPVSGGGQVPGLLGYNLFRNGTFLHYNAHPDSLSYTDANLEPGLWSYTVKAKYDLAPYGFPGQFDESVPAGPDATQPLCGIPLPFTEPWTEGSFSYNGWYFSPAQGNWTFDAANGNPAPSASFSGTPAKSHYDCSLVSPVFNAGNFNCTRLWLDFYLKLTSSSSNRSEHMSAEIWYDNHWTQLEDFYNYYTPYDWTYFHFDISRARGKSFRIRFRANGEHSQLIQSWKIDNIHLYGSCQSAHDLAGAFGPVTLTLSWTPPVCGSNTMQDIILDSNSADTSYSISPGETGYYGNYFDFGTGSGKIREISVKFAGSAGGNHGLAYIVVSNLFLGVISYQFAPPDTGWISIDMQDQPFTGGFFAMVKWGNYDSLQARLCYDTVPPSSSQSFGYYSDGTGFFSMPSQGKPHGNFLLRARIVPGDDFKETDQSIFTGYNLYRSDDPFFGAPYVKLNSVPITQTSYVDSLSVSHSYGYYVTSLFEDPEADTLLCEAQSTTYLVYFAVGVPNGEPFRITVYPNPASGSFTVEGPAITGSVELYDELGQCALSRSYPDLQKVTVSVDNLHPGLFFLKITNSKGTLFRKIILR
jgi:hypothetical protein